MYEILFSNSVLGKNKCYEDHTDWNQNIELRSSCEMNLFPICCAT